MWFWEFLLGMFLAYLLLSPRLRHWIFHRNHTPNIEKRIADEEKREQRIVTPQPILRKGHEVEIEDDSEIREWIIRNPHLAERNPDFRQRNGIKR